MGHYLKFNNVNKIYPNGFQAVYDFNLTVNKGDFVALLGPSGCGKTTTLRMLAGLEHISSGEINLDDITVNNLPPKDRNIAMVFQDYALYPHLTVYENIGFSLIIRKEDKKVIHQKVMEAAALLGLTPFLRRKPQQLSGGQRQRVALGRTIVREPKLFLMDEPMSNLDAKLRNEMRVELVQLHKKLGATTIYVTHDQIEAMTMANVIVVMSNGYIQQIGDSVQIYDQPANIFVASFIGVPTITLLKGKIVDDCFVAANISLKLPAKRRSELENHRQLHNYPQDNYEVVIGIRPETFTVIEQITDTTIETIAEVVELMGNEYFIHFNLNDNNSVARVLNKKAIKIGDKIKLNVDMNKVHFFDQLTTARIK